jgi:hypothetical protein
MTYIPGNGGGGSIATSSDVALNNPTDTEVLTFDSNTNLWTNAPVAASDGFTSQALSADITITASSADKRYRGDADDTTSRIVYISNDNALSIDQPVGFMQAGDGAIEFQWHDDVTVISMLGYRSTYGKGSGCMLIRTGSNTYDLVGDLCQWRAWDRFSGVAGSSLISANRADNGHLYGAPGSWMNAQTPGMRVENGGIVGRAEGSGTGSGVIYFRNPVPASVDEHGLSVEADMYTANAGAQLKVVAYCDSDANPSGLDFGYVGSSNYGLRKNGVNLSTGTAPPGTSPVVSESRHLKMIISPDGSGTYNVSGYVGDDLVTSATAVALPAGRFVGVTINNSGEGIANFLAEEIA